MTSRMRHFTLACFRKVCAQAFQAELISTTGTASPDLRRSLMNLGSATRTTHYLNYWNIELVTVIFYQACSDCRISISFSDESPNSIPYADMGVQIHSIWVADLSGCCNALLAATSNNERMSDATLSQRPAYDRYVQHLLRPDGATRCECKHGPVVNVAYQLLRASKSTQRCPL